MKKIFFLLLSNFADWEAGPLAAALNDDSDDSPKPCCVKTVGFNGETSRSVGGFRVLPDYDISNMPDDYDAIILVGGTSWRGAAAHPVLPVVKDALRQGKLVAGICDGSVFLGMNGFLNDVAHTSNSAQDLSDTAGTAYTGQHLYKEEKAVRGGNIITSSGLCFLEFAREVMLALNAYPKHEVEIWYTEMKTGVEHE